MKREIEEFDLHEIEVGKIEFEISSLKSKIESLEVKLDYEKIVMEEARLKLKHQIEWILV